MNHAWDALLEDFRRRIQLGQIYLSGVPTRPKREGSVRPIPSPWAPDFEFDLFKDAVTIGVRFRYVAVTASQTAPPEAPREPGTGGSSGLTVTADNVPELGDETILALLEEHAKRVVEKGARLIAPGKISLMPMIERKMRYRAQTGELSETLAEEAKTLATWVATKVPSHQVPTAAAIKNALRTVYRGLKAQSNGIIT